MRLDSVIEKQIGKLKSDFADTVVETHKKLKDRCSDPEDAASWLNEILRGTKDEPLVIEESVSDYNDLFRLLQKKWSFTDPTLIQQLVDKLRNVSLNG